jgi:hypothetical protein
VFAKFGFQFGRAVAFSLLLSFGQSKKVKIKKKLTPSPCAARALLLIRPALRSARLVVVL